MNNAEMVKMIDTCEKELLDLRSKLTLNFGELPKHVKAEGYIFSLHTHYDYLSASIFKNLRADDEEIILIIGNEIKEVSDNFNPKLLEYIEGYISHIDLESLRIAEHE